jgi:hypothetical protein
MNQEFKQCLENKKIVPFAGGKKLVNKEITVSDYNAEFSQSGAKALIAAADKFMEKAMYILGIYK